MKKPIYPNETFSSLDEFHDFCMKHQVFGGTALKLKTKMNMLARKLEPKISPKRKT